MAREGGKSRGEEETLDTARERRTWVRGRTESGEEFAVMLGARGGGDSGSGEVGVVCEPTAASARRVVLDE